MTWVRAGGFLAFSLSLALPGAALAYQVDIDFDDQVAPCNFVDTTAAAVEYIGQGVTFDGPGVNDGGGILDECGNFGISGHSSPNFMAFNCGAGFSNGGSPCDPERLLFSSTVSAVQFGVGSASGGTLTATAYDAWNGVVDTEFVSLGGSLQTVLLTGVGIVEVEVDATVDVWILDDLSFEVVVDDVDGDGWSTAAGDCDDSDPAIHPGAVDTCNGIDDNCDGTVDGDGDGDGYGVCTDCDDASAAIYPGADELCNGLDDDCDGVADDDDDGDGYDICDDCDDADPDVNPGMTELCDGLDNDCNGVIPPAELTDADADGYVACEDCDDADSAVHPGAAESCDGVDTDCDGTIPQQELDDDLDGVAECEGDCDDADPGAYPGAPELCDGVDNDCNGLVDDAPDGDGDGTDACGDCDDADPTVYPGADEHCSDGVDNDCDGLVDSADPDCDGGDDDAGDDDAGDDDAGDDDTDGDDDNPWDGESTLGCQCRVVGEENPASVLVLGVLALMMVRRLW